MKARSKNLLLMTAAAPLTALAIAGCGGGGGGGVGGGGNTQLGKIGVWMTTSPASGNNTFTQQERLARPLVNEVFATVSNNRHKINNRNIPSRDRQELFNDIRSFMKFPAGRSDAIADAVANLLTTPGDMMMVDLSQRGDAQYLGVEVPRLGGPFGGRKLTDDVVDLSLGVIFGNSVPVLFGVPDDGNELDGRDGRPDLTKDNVGPQSNITTPRPFPYLPPPA